MDKYFLEHIYDLSEKSRNKGIYVFSDFISPDELSSVQQNARSLEIFSAFGGADGCERTMLRFGDERTLHYEEDFPIKCIKASPLSEKFTDNLTHRDFLGAVMNLSIKREKIGDIILNENTAFIFTAESIADFICENLKKVKHTAVKCTLCDFPLLGELFTLEEKDILSSSLRADCVISAAFSLSRSEANKLFAADKIFINSAVCETPSKLLVKNDRVSVRGRGKFIFSDEQGKTKKEKLKLKLSFYK